MEKIITKNEQKTTKLKYEDDKTYIVTEQKVDHIVDIVQEIKAKFLRVG